MYNNIFYVTLQYFMLLCMSLINHYALFTIYLYRHRMEIICIHQIYHISTISYHLFLHNKKQPICPRKSAVHYSLLFSYYSLNSIFTHLSSISCNCDRWNGFERKSSNPFARNFSLAP